MKELVVTINGKKTEKSNCRLINKEYYLIGDNEIKDSGDVYLIDDRYVRENTGRIAFNHSVNCYQLKNENLIYGIVSMDDRCVFEKGHFNKNEDFVTLVEKDKTINLCINEKIINRSFREEMSTGIYYHISLRKASQFNSIKKISRELKESLAYDSIGIMDKYISRYDNKYNPIINKNIEKYSKAIGNLTFGFEFETIKGSIPKPKLDNLPLIPLRDGSIEGLEYVTIPLKGSKGIKAIIDCVKELDKRTIYNNDCSMHLHIGNVPRTPEFILAFYKLASAYQEEVFSMFPLYKKYNFDVKRKNYSKPFPLDEINFKLDPKINIKNKEDLDKNFNILFKHLAERKNFYDYDCDLNNVSFHPSDPNGHQKWNIKKRYYAVNFIPLIFGNKQTIEFRIHTPTYDIDKILNFLFINSYLINYTIKNQEKILSEPYFLYSRGGGGIASVISNHIVENIDMDYKTKQNLLNYHVGYIEERKNKTYRDGCEGKIVGNEKNIRAQKLIDWEENKMFNGSNYHKIDSSIGNLGIAPHVGKYINDVKKSTFLELKEALSSSGTLKNYFKSADVGNLLDSDLQLSRNPKYVSLSDDQVNEIF